MKTMKRMILSSPCQQHHQAAAAATHLQRRRIRNGKISIDITDSDDDDDDDDDDDCDIDDASTADTAEATRTISPLHRRHCCCPTVTRPMWSSPVAAPSLDSPARSSSVSRQSLARWLSRLLRASCRPRRAMSPRHRERKQLQRATVAHLAKDEALRRADEAAALARAAQGARRVDHCRRLARVRGAPARLRCRSPFSASGARAPSSRDCAANGSTPLVTLQSAWRGRRVRLEYQRQRNIARAQAPAGGAREASHRAAVELERTRAALPRRCAAAACVGHGHASVVGAQTCALGVALASALDADRRRETTKRRRWSATR
jgi:hypothetical protein